MTFWDDLSAEERRVMLTAVEEGWLNGIIDVFLGHPEAGGAVWVMSNDEDAIRDLVPRFRQIVVELVGRGLIEIREPADGQWAHASSLTGPELQLVLEDPKTWIWSANGDNRMVMIMTTCLADYLMNRSSTSGTDNQK